METQMNWANKFYALLTGILLGSGSLMLGLFADDQTNPFYWISLVELALGILTGTIVFSVTWKTKNKPVVMVLLGSFGFGFATTLILKMILPVYGKINLYGPQVLAPGISVDGLMSMIIFVTLGLASLCVILINAFREE